MKHTHFSFLKPFLKSLVLFGALLTFPSGAGAAHILFYYNSLDGTHGSILQCVYLLEAAGYQVKVIDVRGQNRDPGMDNWGAPYDQVWDMRFVDEDKDDCGSGDTAAADYFTERWRAKSIDYLNHCGKLFLAAEHYHLTDRDEGIYRFLREIQAVKPGYDSCPPSARGNSTTDSESFYPVRNGLGPVSFFGAYVGGIPLGVLNGISFVETAKDWQGGDGVKRSIVSGWTEDQLGGAVDAPLCGRGKLLMVWDATMWTLWQPEFMTKVEEVPSIWEDSNWFDWGTHVPEARKETLNYQKARYVTGKFFPAVAKWLGLRDCPCETPSRVLVSRPTAAAGSPATLAALLSPSPLPVIRSGLYPAPPPNSSSAPETILFSLFPINIFMRFGDGPGEYRLDIYEGSALYLKTVFDQAVTSQKESWASWDGTNHTGQAMPRGVYTAILSKNGKALRKIVLAWVSPSP